MPQPRRDADSRGGRPRAYDYDHDYDRRERGAWRAFTLCLSSVRGADPRPRPPRSSDRRRTRSPSPSAARDRSRSPPRRRRRYSNESRSRSRSRSRSPPPAPRDGRRRRHDDEEDDDDAEGNRRGERRRDRGGEGNRREENGGRDDKGKGKDVVTADDAAEVDAQDIAALMGFGGFGTTQVSQLDGARQIEVLNPFTFDAKQGKEHVQEVEGVATKQERHYRQVSRPNLSSAPHMARLTRPFRSNSRLFCVPAVQYMNRKGGFNRSVPPPYRICFSAMVWHC